MLAVCQACQFFLPVIRGHHLLVRSDSRSVMSYINHQAGLVSKRLCMLGNDLLVWAQNVVEEQRLFGGMDASPGHGSENLGKLWQGSSRPLRLQRQLSLPNLFCREHGCPGPQMALCFFPNRSATAGTQTSQGTTAQASFNSPPLEEPTVGVRIIPAADGSPVANPSETGPPFSSERHDMASTARVMGPACVAARRELFSLPERVLNTMAEARAPSTRRLYALKWSIFLACCKDRDLEPVTSEVSVVL